MCGYCYACRQALRAGVESYCVMIERFLEDHNADDTADA